MAQIAITAPKLKNSEILQKQLLVLVFIDCLEQTNNQTSNQISNQYLETFTSYMD